MASHYHYCQYLTVKQTLLDSSDKQILLDFSDRQAGRYVELGEKDVTNEYMDCDLVEECEWVLGVRN